MGSDTVPGDEQLQQAVNHRIIQEVIGVDKWCCFDAVRRAIAYPIEKTHLWIVRALEEDELP